MQGTQGERPGRAEKRRGKKTEKCGRSGCTNRGGGVRGMYTGANSFVFDTRSGRLLHKTTPGGGTGHTRRKRYFFFFFFFFCKLGPSVNDGDDNDCRAETTSAYATTGKKDFAGKGDGKHWFWKTGQGGCSARRNGFRVSFSDRNTPVYLRGLGEIPFCGFRRAAAQNSTARRADRRDCTVGGGEVNATKPLLFSSCPLTERRRGRQLRPGDCKNRETVIRTDGNKKKETGKKNRG